MCTYVFVVFEWWEGEIHPGGMHYGLIRAKNQPEARKKALYQSGFIHDDRAIKVCAHAWRNRSMKTSDLPYLMGIKK